MKMKIGILQTDSVLEKFKPQYGDYQHMFSNLLQRAREGISCVAFDVTQQRYPSHIDACDAYIITGSKASVYENEAWIKRLEDYVRELHRANKKLIAVCFGHQLVAQAMGGRCEKSDKGWGVGVHSIPVLQHESWMLPSLKRYNVVVSHQDQVTQMPKGATLLAGNDFCPHAMFRLGSILTIQGHPEFSKAYGEAAMQNRKEKIEPQHFEAAMQSWHKELDDVALAQWWLNFIEAS